MTMEQMRPPMRLGLHLAAAAAFCSGFVAFGAQAQTRQSVWDGVYTDVQADRGNGQYGQHCAVCHGTALEGNGESPPLVGQFIPDWAGMTLADLYDKIETTMPLNAPGTLRPAIATDILAYILRANNFPAGSKELDAAPDSLKTISFDVFKPKAAAARK
jgi:mono/diheme cytochrome c family protein